MFDKKREISSQHNFHFILDLYFLSTLENIEIQFTLNILLLTFIWFFYVSSSSCCNSLQHLYVIVERIS